MSKLIIVSAFLLASKVSWGQFRMNDTLFFFREKTDSFYYGAFIDTNKKSTFYNEVSDFRFSRFDKDTYKRTLRYLYRNKLYPKKRSIIQIPTEWVMLETYKNKIYVYAPCDYYFHYKVKITDSAFIDWTGEGPEATSIQKFTRTDASTWVFSLKSEMFHNRELTIRYIDKAKGIAIFRSRYFDRFSKKMVADYQLMIDVKKMRNVPLLVNYCKGQKQGELDFDEVDYEAMFDRGKHDASYKQ